MITVQLDNVTKSYGDNPPTVAMDLTIGAGEFFTLLGPSGCGKSTMLRMIAGFLQPSSGVIRFGEKEVTDTPPHKRDTGMVFQNYALFPHMTVAQNVAYGLGIRKVPKAERARRIEKALAQVGLAGYGSRRIDQLSGGQQQRVALARAVVIEPSVLLLDEPLSNLDAKLREETRLQIRQVQRDAGITGIYVTHDQAEAMAMSDRIAVLEAGKVHQIAAPREIYHRPATAFVARFIGNSNVLSATVLSANDDGGVRLRLVGGGELDVAPAPHVDALVGSDVQVSIRPEQLGFGTAQDGILNGIVKSLEFTGASLNYEVECGSDTLTVTVPDSLDAPREGDQVHLICGRNKAWMVQP
ncbi:ABC transporter ATP-binding protein [Psychromicrobium xiongbiense]|uniref:ABC transporter ATP-binding protein n=1 Tax=Psychromicrobium xiongbiense TaxID=3051184 RepID=UPI002557B505|nr:ABC transporter ATP-binding protein [Psychromicrobium sp. YIM S02556]